MDENLFDEYFTVYLIDDMADIYAKKLQPMFKNVAIYPAYELIDNLHISDIDNGDAFCLLFDATFVDSRINDYAIAYAERLIRQNPFMKNHIKALLGDDVYYLKWNSSTQDKQFLYRVQQLPHSIYYDDKIETLYNTIIDIANKLNFKVQSNVIQNRNLPTQFQNEIDELFTYILNIKNYSSYYVDVEQIVNNSTINNPNDIQDLADTIKKYKFLNFDLEHLISQISVLLSTYNAKRISPKPQDFETKRLTDVTSVLQNHYKRKALSLECLNGPIPNLETLFNNSDKIIPISMLELINKIKLTLIQFEDKFAKLHFYITLILSTYKIDTNTSIVDPTNTLPQSGEDE